MRMHIIPRMALHALLQKMTSITRPLLVLAFTLRLRVTLVEAADDHLLCRTLLVSAATLARKQLKNPSLTTIEVAMLELMEHHVSKDVQKLNEDVHYNLEVLEHLPTQDTTDTIIDVSLSYIYRNKKCFQSEAFFV